MIALLLAVAMQPSLTMDLLSLEAERGAAPISTTFDGAKSNAGAVPVPGPAKSGKPDSYHFNGATPVKGVSIYTPVKDQRGDEGNSREEAKDPLAVIPKYKKIAGGIGLLGLLGGFFFAPLWIAGGIGIGAFAVLHVIQKKLAPKKD